MSKVIIGTSQMSYNKKYVFDAYVTEIKGLMIGKGHFTSDVIRNESASQTQFWTPKHSRIQSMGEKKLGVLERVAEETKKFFFKKIYCRDKGRVHPAQA